MELNESYYDRIMNLLNTYGSMTHGDIMSTLYPNIQGKDKVRKASIISRSLRNFHKQGYIMRECIKNPGRGIETVYIYSLP